MRICVCAPDVPYPANRGGRVDVWRRLLAMRQCGHEVLLLTPWLAKPGEDQALAREQLRKHGIDWVLVPQRSGLESVFVSLLHGFQMPSFVVKRNPSGRMLGAMLEAVHAFAPDLVWTEGPWLEPLAKQIAGAANVPLAYRSHNIEHRYMLGQAALTVGWLARMKVRLSFLGLESFERRAIGSADAVFDISLDDLSWWKISHGHWLPPLPVEPSHPSVGPVALNEIVFVGNLKTPNNVAGVKWLVNEVMPLLQSRRAGLLLRIVGSNPDDDLVAAVNAVGGHVDRNVDDPFSFMQRAGVLVNPVMEGSGVQLKMLDMLMTDRPIVTGSQGLRGLPESFKNQVRLAHSPGEFADQVIAALAAGGVEAAARAALRRSFDVRAIDDALSLCTNLSPRPRP